MQPSNHDDPSLPLTSASTQIQASCGWESLLPAFEATESAVIRQALHQFIRDASPEQLHAWDDSIPKLKSEFREVLQQDKRATQYGTILEYQLPMESRRPDVIVLAGDSILVLEFKGKTTPSQADLDQAAAYARDLRCYHRECEAREVHAVVVPTRASGYQGHQNHVHVVGPDALDQFVRERTAQSQQPALTTAQFLSHDAYRPLPSLVRAARELFQHGELRTIRRARAATDPAVDRIKAIVHQAAKERSRTLILVTGVPGAGKTLVGLRTVHAHYLDDLAIARPEGAPTAPAVFLSGNGPLVQVLQYELRAAGGEGKTFVRGVKDYVDRYSRPSSPVPPEHVLVFDEAQRAHDAQQVSEVHKRKGPIHLHKSEPEHFVDFANRIPEWSVIVGLIGSGQEIHVGEEAGIGQWRKALELTDQPESWSVHGPTDLATAFQDSTIPYTASADLNLNTEIRFHLATNLHHYVASLLANQPAQHCSDIAQSLEHQGYHLRITRSLNTARTYLQDRYAEYPEARFGLIASSKDKHLEAYGIPNDFQSTKRVKFGPWYSDDPTISDYSCRHLTDAITEFGAQGLELDAALLAWGTDFRRDNGHWSNAFARGYKRGAHVKDPFQLRLNAYRVLLTRGRDATVVFIPPIQHLTETYEHLVAAGFKEL